MWDNGVVRSGAGARSRRANAAALDRLPGKGFSAVEAPPRDPAAGARSGIFSLARAGAWLA